MFYYVPYPPLQVPAMGNAYLRTPMTFPPVDAHAFQKAAKESTRLVADASSLHSRFPVRFRLDSESWKLLNVLTPQV